MEIVVLAIQARILQWTALAGFAGGIYLEHEWLTIAWRTALAAVIAMWVCGMLLRQVAKVIDDRLAADFADAQAAEADQAGSVTPQAGAAPARRPAGRPPSPVRA